jgi:small GTP-binding protein
MTDVRDEMVAEDASRSAITSSTFKHVPTAESMNGVRKDLVPEDQGVGKAVEISSALRHVPTKGSVVGALEEVTADEPDAGRSAIMGSASQHTPTAESVVGTGDDISTITDSTSRLIIGAGSKLGARGDMAPAESNASKSVEANSISRRAPITDSMAYAREDTATDIQYAGKSTITDSAAQRIPAAGSMDDAHCTVTKFAIVGRPNVGKSTFVNSILGEDRQLVADFAGLTRESSEFAFEFSGHRMAIIDTPGIRRNAKISDDLERASALTSRTAYKEADMVILVIDATSLVDGQVERQDLNLAASIVEEHKALIIVFNKCDKILCELDSLSKSIRHDFTKNFAQFKRVPFLLISARDEGDVSSALELAFRIYEKHKVRIRTSILNDWLHSVGKADILQRASLGFKLKYVMQTGTVPPTFVIFASNKQNIRKAHERFITNNLRQNFNLTDVVVDIRIKSANKSR